MDVSLTAVLAGLGLSGAAGLNAWLPSFAAALLTRLDVVQMGEPFDELSSTPALIVLGLLMVGDFVGDKIPAIDHVLHFVGMVVAPVAGTALFHGQIEADESASLLASVLGGGTVATVVHTARAALRPLSSATTLGVGNPVLSLIEDAGSASLTVAAFLIPVLAVIGVVAIVAGAFVIWRRRRRHPFPR
jgi:hypothetical protein